MAVTFDRAVDMSTVNAQTVRISPPQSEPGFHLDFSYNDATRTLYIDSDPWLDDNKDCTLTVTTAVKGSDGSDVGTEYAWSFATGVSPKGTVKIEGGERSMELISRLTDITCSDVGYYYTVAKSEAAVGSLGWQGPLGTISNGNTSVPFTFAGASDGLQTVYYQFKTTDNRYSAIRPATITLDTTAPVVTLSSPIYLNQSTTTGRVLYPTITETGSGIDASTWLWTPAAVDVDRGRRRGRGMDLLPRGPPWRAHVQG